ncbi:hypothetical protein [Nocardioides sp.]|uniref:hypothetical protein n=1 Tax=Nocardioides sp. TaxID=35761 RepID=UPI003517E0AF
MPLRSRIPATVAAAAGAATLTALLAAPAQAHVGLTWDAPQPPQLSKTTFFKLAVPHGCSITDAAMPAALEKLGLGSGFLPVAVPGHAEKAGTTWEFSTTSVEVSLPRQDATKDDAVEWLGVRAGGVTAEFKPGSGWRTSLTEGSTTTTATWAINTEAPIAEQDSALPYHDVMQFGLRASIRTNQNADGSYQQPTVSQPYTDLAPNKFVLQTRQGCEVDFSDGTTTVRKTIYAGDILNGWGKESPTATVGLDPTADLTRGPQGPAGPEGPAGPAGQNGQDGASGTPAWGGEFTARSAKGALVVSVDAARRYAGKMAQVRSAGGTVLLSRKLDKAGDLDARVAKAAARAGSSVTLVIAGKAVATDAV